jgi:PAS domain S-box-containing protein
VEERLFNAFDASTAGDAAIRADTATPPPDSNSAETLRQIVELTIEEHSRLEALLASLQEAVLIFDGDGDLVDVNDAAFRLYGYGSREEMVCTYEDSLIHKRSPDGRNLSAEESPSALARAGCVFQNQECETWIADTNTRFVGSYSGSPVVDESGNTVAAVVTVHNVTSHHERMRLDAALDRIGLVTQSSLDSGQILSDMIAQMCAVLETDAGFVALRSDGHWIISFAEGVEESFLNTQLTDRELPLAVTAERSRRVVHGKHGSAKGSVSFGDPEAAYTEMCVPLIVGDTFFGVIALLYPIQNPLSEAQLDFMKRLAANVSLALNNARLYQAERRVANTLQEALLQVPERIEGVEFAVRYESATDIARVGGDFYDIFCVGSSHVCLVMGDVAGKGLEAAVLTSLVKNTIRAYCSAPVNPAAVLERANDILLAHTETHTFVTVILGLLDLRDGHLVYSNAGHTAGLLLRKNGTLAYLGTNSPLAGAFESVRFTSSEAHMAVGDSLLLYTDGLTEARSGREMFGEERLLRAVAQRCGEAPCGCVDRVLGDVSNFAGGHLQDDVALLAVKRLEFQNGQNGCQETLF